jgi:hypothetical protein
MKQKRKSMWLVLKSKGTGEFRGVIEIEGVNEDDLAEICESANQDYSQDFVDLEKPRRATNAKALMRWLISMNAGLLPCQ